MLPNTLKPSARTLVKPGDDPWDLAPKDPNEQMWVDLDERRSIDRVAETAPPMRAPQRLAPWLPSVVAGLTLIAVASAGTLWLSGETKRSGDEAGRLGTGTVILSSHPESAMVTIDGQARGTTPLVVRLPAGRHDISVADANTLTPERLSVEVIAGAEWRRHVVLPSGAQVATGALRVESSRAGDAITIDGLSVGVTPLTASDLAPGEHVVQVAGAGGLVTRRVEVARGTTLSLVLAAEAPTAPLSAWIAVASPFDVQVFEGGRLLGVSQSERIMVGAGRHSLDLVNDALGYRSLQAVTVGAGRTLPVAIDPPVAPVSMNALPWATVSVDGRPLGDTPIANASLSIGGHAVTFSHPTLGERTATVTVRLGAVNRVSVDLRKTP